MLIYEPLNDEPLLSGYTSIKRYPGPPVPRYPEGERLKEVQLY